jgi:hypothetical protein
MLTQQICLVLGAGASKPYRFPTGAELKALACGAQSEEWWPLAKAVTGFGPDEHVKFVERVIDSGVSSIDQFAGAISSYKQYAKALIAYHIGRVEHSTTVIQAQEDQDWLNYLKQQFVNPAQKFSELKSIPPTVVTFNYDRSFEEGMLRRLTASFEDVTRQSVAEYLRTWQIVHVHGSIGPHPELAADGKGRAFAHTLDPDALRAAMEQIILVRDANPDSEEFTRARESIRGAATVFFLGFAFDPLNLDRILPKGPPNDLPPFYATRRADSATAIRKATAPGGRMPNKVPLGGNIPDCRWLLDEYAHIYSD